MRQHYLSNSFPAMSSSELADLAIDIKANGQRHPIVIYDEMILDGWHRYKACLEAGVEPEFVNLNNGVNPAAYVQSMNLHRRHLNGSQRAMAVVACSQWADSGRPGKGEATSPFQTVDEMAKAAEVSTRTIQQAKKAHEAGLGEAVRDGKVSAERAAALAPLAEADRQAALKDPATKRLRIKRTSSSDPAAQKDHVQALEGQVRDREAEIKDQAQLLQDIEEENKEMRRILQADDKLVAALAEVKQFKEMVRVTQERNNDLMKQNHSLATEAKRWKNKFQNLERMKEGQADRSLTSNPDSSASDGAVD